MLKVNNLCKAYPSFKLDNVSFELPEGYIMGFIGMNGAGKTTTLKSVLNIVKPDGGSVEIFGKDMAEHETGIKQDIALMPGPVTYYPKTRISKLFDIYKRFYRDWDDAVFESYMKKFKIDKHKKVCELSAGMKVKFGLALALSHNARLLILDEPTSGLDPIARDELLDIFRQIVDGGEKSILFSTHITSDLDKCADYIIFIKDGKIILNDTKDEIINSHTLVKGGNEDFERLKGKAIGFKKNAYGFSALILKNNAANLQGIKTEIPNLEDIMLYYNLDGAGILAV